MPQPPSSSANSPSLSADGSFDRLLAKLARVDVLAIDDWGLVPLSDPERRHLLEVLEDRSGARSTVLTSQFPVPSWHDLVGSPTLADAILERILSNHHAIALQGETLRPVRKTNGDPKTQHREEEA